MGRKTQISLFDNNNLTYEIKKHSSMVQMSNITTLQERKAMNAMIRIARDVLKRNKGALSFTCDIGLIKRLAGLNDSDNTTLKNALINLRNTAIEYNIFQKDKKTWGVFGFLAEAKIEEFGRGKPTKVTFEFPTTIQQVIEKPEMYVKLNLLVLRGLDSKHSIALYEVLKDYQGLGQYKFDIDGFRKLMGIKEGQYSIFTMLKKRVLDKAVDEINNKTDLQVEYEVERLGRKVIGLLVRMKAKNSMYDNMNNDSAIIDKLKAFGISDNKIERLLNQHDEQYIIVNIAIVEEQMKKGKVKNPTGYLLRAFQEDYRPQETEYSKNLMAIKEETEELKQIQQLEQQEEAEQAIRDKEQRRANLLSRLDVMPLDLVEEYRLEYIDYLESNTLLKKIYEKKGIDDPILQANWLRYMEKEVF